MDQCKISILGTEYDIRRVSYADEPAFERSQITGYCNRFTKKIVFCDMLTHPNWTNEEDETKIVVENETLRHEIVHAFFGESGLAENSGRFEEGWAETEELVDWIALQGEKIYRAWQKAELEMDRNFRRA